MMTQRERRSELYLRAPRAWRSILAAVLVPLLLIAGIAGLQGQFRESEALRAQASQSYDRRMGQVTLLSQLKDAETAQRGFLLTGDPDFLKPYEPARVEIAAQIGAMRGQAGADMPETYVRRVAGLVEAKFEELDRTIAAARRGDRQGALGMVASGNGKRLMDALRVTIGAMIDREAALSDSRREAFLDQRAGLQRLMLLACMAAVLVLLAFLYLGWRLRHERYLSLVDAFEAAERNATILNSTIDAILILNPSGTIELINAAASGMLGFASKDLERKDVASIIDIAPGEGSFHKRIGLVEGQLSRSFLADRVVRHHEGHHIAVDVAMGVMSLPSGDHIVLSLRDISERKRIERVKDDLMSTVSHELRTPLTSVVGSLGLLRAGSVGLLPEGAARLVEIAENNSRRLIRLINDMLDIDRIESGQLHMLRDPMDLRLLIDQACTGSEGLAKGRGVKLECHKPDRPVMVAGDQDRLLQVVTNLLSNAIRAAPQGSAVRLSTSVDPGGRALVTVDDSGAGIPIAFRSRIFGRFERGAPHDGSTGTGLGLAISREIILRHDGMIWFEDRDEGGTRFAFALPRIGALAEQDVDAPRILICEQDEATACAIVALAMKEGCAYDLARNGDEARAILGQRDYAALIVDLHLPEEGGLAFTRLVRDGDGAFCGPVIVVSSSVPGDGEQLAPLDMIDWIEKPGDADRLSSALRTALRRTDARRPTILHLDDDRDLLDVVAAALEPEARIITATDIAEAMALLQTSSPDAVILDIQLAHGSGLDLMPFLVDREGVAIPTIIYSAQDAASDVIGQVDAVLVKARGSIPDLKATVRRVVRSRMVREMQL
ncbi:CHASE3 domain-containing protein [Sphingomonas sp.]|uniref:CHASE3 domain-containing protein n=1 Tax=Sphingomonas sp. TaxID=28214 RepID=UPI000DB26D2A|nr:CHASE3 domain-containing protein [Sphingomonas sp.]PZU09814.1 MAG: histidine kinase [Sphingomonas sp.]